MRDNGAGRDKVKTGQGFIKAVCLAGAIAGLLLPAGAAEASGEVAVIARSGASPETSVAIRLLQQELGRPIGDMDIATAGLEINRDTLPELLVFPLVETVCPSDGCRPRLLAISDGTYVDLFAGLAWPERITPDQFLVSPSYHGQYDDLVVGGRTLVHNGSAYVDAATIEPTRLDKAAFLEACSQSDTTRGQLEGYGRDPAADGPELCECLAEGFQSRQHSQQELDLYWRHLANDATDEELYGANTAMQDVSDIGLEVQESCMGLKGWKEPITPSTTDDYPPGYGALNFEGLMDACTGQPWVTGNHQLGTPQRALAFCGCLTSGVLKAGYGQSAVDRLTSFYRDEISEADFEPDLPSLLDEHDKVSESCINSIRWTTR
jgi:8-oxo-dGTP pyrophosphatase MutT (NUDIX family)